MAIYSYNKAARQDALPPGTVLKWVNLGQQVNHMPSLPPVAPGQRLEVTLLSLAAGGEAVARCEGYTLFVPFAAPGDRAEVEVASVGRRFGRARLLRVVAPGPDRVGPSCPDFGDCGGCQLQHLAYPAQLAAKQAFVEDALRRLAKLQVPVAATLPSRPHWHYRNATEFTATPAPQGLAFGCMRYHSHEVLPIDKCAISHAATNNAMRTARELLRGRCANLAPAVAGLTVRVSEASGQALVILHLSRPEGDLAVAFARALMAELPTVAGVLATGERSYLPRPAPMQLLHGRGYLEHQLGTYRYRVSASSFFQVNTGMAARLAEVVQALAQPQPGELVLDAYAGVGTLSLPLGSSTGRVALIEQVHAALVDARRNLRPAVPEVAVHQGRVESRLPALARGGARADLVVLDPPRRGCPEVVLRSAAALRARAIVLVSCDPATFARDLALLTALGYPPVSVTPLDMFPQTWHVEAVALCRQEQ